MAKTTPEKGQDNPGNKADMEGSGLHVRVELPWPPSVNHYWGVRKPTARNSARRYIKPEGLAFRQTVFWLVAEARGPLHRYNPLRGPVGLSVLLSPPDRRVRDLDNVLKALMDSLTFSGCIEDDHQVRQLTVDYPEFNAAQAHGLPSGRCWIEVSIQPSLPIMADLPGL